VRPRYADWEKRQRRAIELYRRGLEPREVARRMRLSPTTVWRYLRLAGEPHHTALSVPNVSVLPRPPFWALHERLGSCEVVCGRKFCSRCGRWRHLADFPRDSHKRGVALSHCAACQKAVRRYGYHHETEAQRANRRERPCAQAFIRVASAPAGRGPARHPGAARPRAAEHDRALYARQRGATRRGVPEVASQGPVRRENGETGARVCLRVELRCSPSKHTLTDRFPDG